MPPPQDGGVGGGGIPRVPPVAIFVRSLRDECPGYSFPLRPATPRTSQDSEEKENKRRGKYLFMFVQLRLFYGEDSAKVEWVHSFLWVQWTDFCCGDEFLSTRWAISSGIEETGSIDSGSAVIIVRQMREIIGKRAVSGKR